MNTHLTTALHGLARSPSCVVDGSLDSDNSCNCLRPSRRAAAVASNALANTANLCLEAIIGSRMMGGGFGGCTINLIQDDFIGQFVDESCKAYYRKFGKEATPILAELDNGITIKKT